jgi:hypothetical protein
MDYAAGGHGGPPHYQRLRLLAGTAARSTISVKGGRLGARNPLLSRAVGGQQNADGR